MRISQWEFQEKVTARSTYRSVAQSSQRNLHLAHEAILVNTLALAVLRLLGPHLLHVLENHVAVTVERLDTGEELAVVAAGNQDLGVVAGSGLQQRQRTCGKLMLFDEGDFIFAVCVKNLAVSLSVQCM